MTINGSGTITGLSAGGLPDATIQQADLATNVASNGPAFSAYQSSSQTLTGGGATKIQCQTEEFDTNSNYDNTTNYRFTPTVAGYYQITGCWTAASVGANLSIAIYKNGSDFKRGTNIQASAAVVQVTALIYLNGSTDYAELYCASSANQAGNTGANFTYFQGVLIRAA
jgi:hypothetical protein